MIFKTTNLHAYMERIVCYFMKNNTQTGDFWPLPLDKSQSFCYKYIFKCHNVFEPKIYSERYEKYDTKQHISIF